MLSGGKMKSVDLSVIIPAYNEAENIKEVLEEVKKAAAKTELKHEIIVVDDGSTDGTADVVKGSGVRLLNHPENRGYGASLKTGIKNASGELILITDADGTYTINEIPRMINESKKYDMVVGARTGGNVKIELYRRPAKWLLSRLANFLSGTKIPDLNSGMRVFRKKDAERFFHILPSGFSFTTTITLAYLSNNYTINYIPINYYKRGGESKINPLRDGFNFISLIIKTMTYFDPLKVFLPVAFALLVTAIIVFAYSFFVFNKIMDVTVIVLIVSSIQIALFGLLADLIAKRGV